MAEKPADEGSSSEGQSLPRAGSFDELPVPNNPHCILPVLIGRRLGPNRAEPELDLPAWSTFTAPILPCDRAVKLRHKLNRRKPWTSTRSTRFTRN